MVNVNPPQDESKASHKDRTLVLVVLLMVVTFAFGLLSGYVLWGTGGQKVVVAQAPTPAGQGAAAADETQNNLAKRVDVPVDGNPAFGPDTAPVTIIEFSDYQCPYCKKWALEIWPQIKTAYGDKIRLVYRDFPISTSHPQATPAALAARCAGEQNQYFAFHDKIFGGATLSDAVYPQYAQELQLDMAKFNDCLQTSKYKDAVEKNYDYAANLGINGTPTFFINGIPMVGAQPFANFKSVIDQELAAK